MRAIKLILNGKSASREDVRTSVLRLRSEGCVIDVGVTWEGGDATRLAASARDANMTIVAGGGDGTVNEVLSGLLDSGLTAPLSILPLGTANDFACGAGIPLADPYAALHLAASGDPVAVDVGVMNGRPFLNLASGGFGAEVTARTPVNLKNSIGGTAYGLMALLMAMKAHPYRGRLTTPERTYEGAMVMMAVGNGRQAGGGARMTPEALVDDGAFDVLVVPDHKHARFAHVIADLAALKFGASEDFHYLRCPQLTVESEDLLQFNLDGEPVRGKEFRFEIQQGALSMILPEECPMLGSSPGKPPERQPLTDQRKKILSLDGGGIRGIISIEILAEMERQIRESLGAKAVLADFFDFFAGTSTGAITATALSLRWDVRQDSRLLPRPRKAHVRPRSLVDEVAEPL